MLQTLLFFVDLADVADGGEGYDETSDGRGADAGEVAGKGFRAIGLLPRGLVEHSAQAGDLVQQGCPAT